MRAPPMRSRRTAGVLSCAFLLAGFTVSDARSSPSASAARCWADGDAESALAALEASRPGRERTLNRAVVWLYMGQAAQAEAELAELHRSEPRWTPALRWLARAEHQLGLPDALDHAAALLAMPGADVHDQLWAGRLFREHGDLQRARAAEGPATALRGGEPIPTALQASHHRLVPPGLYPGETLRYRVKYLFLNLASITLETGGQIRHGGTPAHRVVFTAKSNDGIPFFNIDSRFESVVGQDGAVLAHRHVASDSDTGDDTAGYDMDREADRCTVRTVRDGLFGYDVLPLPANAQDGVSVMLVARALARVRGSAVVPTAVDSNWWPTQLRTLGTERISWRGIEVQTVRMQSVAHYRGPGGLSGVIDIWVSDDERALPYKVKMKVAVGSVVLELLPEGPTSPARAQSAGVVTRGASW